MRRGAVVASCARVEGEGGSRSARTFVPESRSVATRSDATRKPSASARTPAKARPSSTRSLNARSPLRRASAVIGPKCATCGNRALASEWDRDGPTTERANRSINPLRANLPGSDQPVLTGARSVRSGGEGAGAMSADQPRYPDRAAALRFREAQLLRQLLDRSGIEQADALDELAALDPPGE